MSLAVLFWAHLSPRDFKHRGKKKDMCRVKAHGTKASFVVPELPWINSKGQPGIILLPPLTRVTLFIEAAKDVQACTHRAMTISYKCGEFDNGRDSLLTFKSSESLIG